MAPHYLNSQMGATLLLAWEAVKIEKATVRKSYKKLQCAVSLHQSGLLPGHSVC